ncbi:MAG: FAD-dependent oxidoreductase [Cytophagales bacterium]
MKTAIILGGGVAGLSAAHELVKRGFKVKVYETKSILGGKARSFDVPDSNLPGFKPLPGEHGFRFFPKFYKHVTATMKEIPFKNKTVYDNLVDTTEIKIARYGKKSFLLPASLPTSLSEIKKYIERNSGVELGLSNEEKDYFANRIWQLMSSCFERRKNEYERVGWWEFVEADRFSEAYKTFCAKGLTRTLVAARAEDISTKTGGDILLQLTFDVLKPGKSSDRILNGPTNQVWIDPWVEFLKKKGVEFYVNSKVISFETDNFDLITSVNIKNTENQSIQNIKGDVYLSAMPVEVMANLLNDEMLHIDPTLEYLKELKTHVSWMSGLQLYLKEDVPLNHGHTIYIDTPWALTSISQAQFWKNYDWANHGDGTVKGILSIDISDWFSSDELTEKTAFDWLKEKDGEYVIVKKVWEQLQKSLNIDGEVVLRDDMLHSWNLDPAIATGIPPINIEPLLVNNKNTWPLRPFAYTDISNLFLASDYVKTNTDLATMEGANEAARRAVNAILSFTGVRAKRCKVWKLHEPWWLVFLRLHDRNRYNKGLPWNGKVPISVSKLTKILSYFS